MLRSRSRFEEDFEEKKENLFEKNSASMKKRSTFKESRNKNESLDMTHLTNHKLI